MLALYKNEHYVEKQRKGQVLHNEKKHTNILNPQEEDYLEAGYLPLTDSERPEYNPETEYLETTYELREKDILIHYEVKEIQPEPEPEEE